MIKILYTFSTLQRSGPALIVYNLIKALDRSRYQPVVLTLSKEPAVSLKEDFEKLGVPVISLHLSRIGGLFLGRRKIRQAVEQIRPDIIHAQGFRDICLTACLKSGYKKIATLHCDFDADYPFRYGKLLGKCMAAIQWCALRSFSARVCVSSFLANILNKRQRKLHFSYVNNGVDTSVFYPAADKKALRRELGLPEDKTIFIWIGSFVKTKNPMLLVQLIKTMQEKRAFFVFCGARGPLLEPARHILQGFENVLFTGYTDKVSAYLQASDCYISTSLSEGFHLTVYEALACGLQVILSDLPVYQLLKKSGCGLFFPSQNGQVLQSQIQECLNGKAKLALPEGEKLVHRYFSSHAMSQAYQQFYEECVK